MEGRREREVDGGRERWREREMDGGKEGKRGGWREREMDGGRESGGKEGEREVKGGERRVSSR